MGQKFEIPDPDWTVEPRRVGYGEATIPVDVFFRGRLVFTYNYANAEDIPDYEMAEDLAVKEFAARLQKVLGEA